MAKNGFSMSNRVATESVSDSTTLTVNDCGKVFVMASASAAYTITLPTPEAAEAGWNCKIVKGADSDKAHIVTSQAADMSVVGYGSDTDGVNYSGSAGTQQKKITLSASNAKQGDTITLVTDGSSWYAEVKFALQTGYATSAS